MLFTLGTIVCYPLWPNGNLAGANVMMTMMASVNVVACLNAIEHAVLGANVDAQPKEEYDKAWQHTIAKNEAKFALIFGCKLEARS